MLDNFQLLIKIGVNINYTSFVNQIKRL